MTPELTGVLALYGWVLGVVAWLTVRNARRLREQEIIAQERSRNPAWTPGARS